MYRFTLILSLAYIFGITFMLAACSSSEQSTPVPEKEERKATGPAKIIATVEFASYGCFHHRKAKLLILQKGDLIVARIENEGKTPVEKKLGIKEIEAFKSFCNQLKDLQNDGSMCTTVDSYKVSFDNETISKSDESCRWHGFYNLYSELFNSDYMSAFN